MKINVAFPATGCQKLFEVNDEIKVSLFFVCVCVDKSLLLIIEFD